MGAGRAGGRMLRAAGVRAGALAWGGGGRGPSLGAIPVRQHPPPFPCLAFPAPSPPRPVPSLRPPAVAAGRTPRAMAGTWDGGGARH